jgi:hypothetical protein
MNVALARSPSGARASGQTPSIVNEAPRSPSVGLEGNVRRAMESRFGHDFSRVRVHTDAIAARSAAALGQGLPGRQVAHLVLRNGSLAVQRDGSDAAPRIERNMALDPNMFLKPMNAPAVRETAKCEEFPGGSTDCEVDAKTGTPTGKVTHKIDETNPCTRPCVEEHEAVHVKQMKTFCPELRDCYLAVDKGRRPVTECIAMAIFGSKARECAAYNVSVPCMEKRMKTSKACQSAENKEYGTRKLASEKCFRDNACSKS